MPNIHEISTVTSKGQITLPKSIRQILGVNSGDKIAFHLTDGQIVVTRSNEEHHRDPAIAGFLSILEKDIQSGRNVTTLPDDLARSMAHSVENPGAGDTNEDIDGDVAI